MVDLSVEAGGYGIAVSGKVFGTGKRDNRVADLAQSGFRVGHSLPWAQECVRAQRAGVAGVSVRRQDMIRSGEVVPQRHRRKRTHKNCPRVANARSQIGGITRVNLEVFGSIRVADDESDIEVRHDNNARLFARQGGSNTLCMGIPTRLRPLA